MNSNPFLSKEVKFKRISKGFAIAFPVIIMIFVIGSYYFNLIDNTLRNHYVGDKKEIVLGTEKTDIQIEYPDEFEEITKGYDIDEYIYNWDEEVDGFYTQSNYIREPIFYTSGDTAKVSQTWILKNGYKLELYCPPKKLKDVIPGEYYQCTVKYNNILISDTVRHWIAFPDEGKTVSTQVSLVVYSPSYYEKVNTYEIIVVGTYAGGSYDDISVFKLENGKSIQLKFFCDDELQDTWMVSNPMSFRLLRNEEGDLKLVTHFWNPASAPVKVHRIWNLDEKVFRVEKTIGDIIE